MTRVTHPDAYPTPGLQSGASLLVALRSLELGCYLWLRASWSTHSSGLSSWALSSSSCSHPVNLGRRHTLPVGSYCHTVSRLCVDTAVCSTTLSGEGSPCDHAHCIPEARNSAWHVSAAQWTSGSGGPRGKTWENEQTPDSLVSRGFSSAFSFPLTHCPIKMLMWVEPHVFIGSALQYIIDTFTLFNLPDHWLTCGLSLSHGTGLKSIHDSGHSSWIRFISFLTPLIFPPSFKLLAPRGHIFSVQFPGVLRAFNVHHLPRAYKELGVVPCTRGGQNNGPLTNVHVLVFWNPWTHYGRWQRDSADVT